MRSLATPFVFLFGLLLALPLPASDRHPRPMLIHTLPELGLQVWTEMTPQ